VIVKMAFIRWINPLRGIVTCVNSAPFDCWVTCYPPR
jgi:hypothetical protein